MKKTLSILLLLFITLTTIQLPVFADDTAYVPSIGVRSNIGIEGGEINPETGCYEIWDWCENCHRKLVVTPYIFKETIESSKSRADIDIAYEQIMAAEKVYDLTVDVIPVAHNMGVHEDDLVIRDLFDITDYYCQLQGSEIEITVSTETLKRFVCLLHYVDEAWEVVPDVYVDNNGYDKLTLHVDHLSPFAIVVYTDMRYVPEEEGHIHGLFGKCIWHWFTLLTALITTLLSVLIKKEKKKIRDIILIINIILCIIFTILGSCWWDIPALLLDLVIVVLVYRKTHKEEDDKQEESENEKQ